MANNVVLEETKRSLEASIVSDMQDQMHDAVELNKTAEGVRVIKLAARILDVIPMAINVDELFSMWRQWCEVEATEDNLDELHSRFNKHVVLRMY